MQSLMEVIGYIAAVLIGISLGLIGGGGSSLALPVLVYLFHINAQAAVSDSFFIVGLASLAGALTYIYQKQICYKSVLVFGLPSVIGVFVAHRVIFKAIPERIIVGNLIDISKDMLILLFFSALMIAASVSMIRPLKSGTDPEVSGDDYPFMKLMLGGTAVGLVAGLVGAGGGFLIIPALVILIRMPMKKAIGTSLMIITVNSAIGMFSHMSDHALSGWPFLLLFGGLAICGILIGKYISKFVSGAKLKPAFGWFILVIGIFIITQQFYKIHP
ncbi:MAG TPA: sulfite exporter TauE/SafE family protein [Bacteroidia bacterium]|nr:sulfite exporter TauE/SafE family protein [Bacteroidia bacterium]